MQNTARCGSAKARRKILLGWRVLRLALEAAAWDGDHGTRLLDKPFTRGQKGAKESERMLAAVLVFRAQEIK